MRDAGPHVSIDAYLAEVPPTQRAALQSLRETILDVAPGAVECLSYGMPAFRVDGRVICYFAATRKHCAFYPGGLVPQFEAELAGFSTSKGTIRFQPEAPIPDPLLRRIVADCVERANARGRKG
jgi:uncharacterized protein YdhG (YjbR/CyaY superfamily)